MHSVNNVLGRAVLTEADVQQAMLESPTPAASLKDGTNTWTVGIALGKTSPPYYLHTRTRQQFEARDAASMWLVGGISRPEPDVPIIAYPHSVGVKGGTWWDSDDANGKARKLKGGKVPAYFTASRFNELDQTPHPPFIDDGVVYDLDSSGSEEDGGDETRPAKRGKKGKR